MFSKRVPYVNKKIRAAANGEECTLTAPGICNGRTDTTVFAHLNNGWAGKGLAQKADDCAGFFACYNCHTAYDGESLGEDECFLVLRAYYRTIRRLIDKGVLT